ncbi:hypothetical protein [Clostridium sp. BJN0001]|uniref:hypothetical protein n=1 Tax=Clostridium sp. BJN0001 TaxID=2930219 RepID=UPI001FD5A9F0|nr:hypothetical protein [Clostridium sp. BJN0001]
MKKYFNKALIYQWFKASKAAIILSLLFWSFLSSQLIKREFSTVVSGIRNYQNNSFYSISIAPYACLGFIFVAIYFMSIGFNKKLNEMFLMSGPYTKKQIKYNELICLAITLLMFVGVFLYFALYIYLDNKLIIDISYGYSYFIILETLKIIFLGIIGILIMLIILSMFNNTFAGIVTLLFVIPETFIFILLYIRSVISYFKVYNNEIIEGYRPLAYFGRDVSINISEINFKYAFYDVLILIATILILYLVYVYVNKIIENKTGNRIFVSKYVENFICLCVSFECASFICVMAIEYFNIGSGDILSISTVNYFTIMLITPLVLTAIIFFILKKILRTVK